LRIGVNENPILKTASENIGESLKVSIAGHGASTMIEIFGYERPSAENEADANWLKCRVTISAAEINGSFHAEFRTHEFARFRDALKPVLIRLGGEATFETIERELECKIELTGTGGAHVHTVAKTRGMVAWEILFSYESDQSFLAESLRELEAIIAKYPVRKCA